LEFALFCGRLESLTSDKPDVGIVGPDQQTGQLGIDRYAKRLAICCERARLKR
jgi:hypothetical protein